MAVFSRGTPNSNRWMLGAWLVQVSLLPLLHSLLGCRQLGNSKESDRFPGDSFHDRRRRTLENSRARCGPSPVSLHGHGMQCWVIIILSASDNCKYKAQSRKLSDSVCPDTLYSYDLDIQATWSRPLAHKGSGIRGGKLRAWSHQTDRYSGSEFYNVGHSS